MNARRCATCEGMDSPTTIRSPEHLQDVLAAILTRLREGTLTRVGAPAAGDDLVVVLSGGQRPDWLQASFQCVECCADYELTVELYHGAGGVWRRHQTEAER